MSRSSSPSGLTPDGLTAADEHEVLSETARMLFVLRHNTPPALNGENLTAGLDANVQVFYDSRFAFRESLRGDSFETTYAQLNRLFSKCYHLEKSALASAGASGLRTARRWWGCFCSHSATAGCAAGCRAR